MARWDDDEFRRTINGHVQNVNWRSGWKNTWHGMASWGHGVPVALMLHHTAGAQTESADPKHPGNQSKADDGVANFVWRHPQFHSPASQFTLRRSGQLDVNAYLPCYHAGLGDFKGTEWAPLSIPKDSANRFLMGVEIVSKGHQDDLTDAQWDTLATLVTALNGLAGWNDTSTLRLPRHRDWAPGRKSDIIASNAKVQHQLKKRGAAGAWDGQVPDIEGILRAESDGIANPAAWRLACRLKDLGFYKGDVQPKGEQRYPAKAMVAYNEKYAPNMADKSKYGPKAHERIFGK